MVGKTNRHLPLPPRPLHNPEMINQHRRKKCFSGIRKSTNLPDGRAPELRVEPEVRRDVDGGHVFQVEEGERDRGGDRVDQEDFREGRIC